VLNSLLVMANRGQSFSRLHLESQGHLVHLAVSRHALPPFDVKGREPELAVDARRIPESICVASVRVGDAAVPNVLGAGDGAAPRRAITNQLKFKSGGGRIYVRYFGDLGQRPRLQQIAAESSRGYRSDSFT